MRHEEIILAWKNPEYRETIKNIPPHPSGKGVYELSDDEMKSLYGSGDPSVQPMSSFACGALVSFVGSYLVTAVFCK